VPDVVVHFDTKYASLVRLKRTVLAKSNGAEFGARARRLALVLPRTTKLGPEFRTKIVESDGAVVRHDDPSRLGNARRPPALD
jgi:hypothetical protein